MHDKSMSPAPERFPATLATTAEIAGVKAEEICDYIRAGALSYAFRADGTLGGSVWISYDDLRHIVRDPDHGPVPAEALTADQRKILDCCRAVRSLLAAKPPATSTTEAIARSTGVVVQTRQREPYICVRATDVVAHARISKRFPYAQLESIMAWAMGKCAAEQVRGIRGLDDDKQSWATWYRLPHSLVAPMSDNESGWVVDFPQIDPAILSPDPGPTLLGPPALAEGLS